MLEALYIHIPFCANKCNYCDFISFSGCSEEIKDRYISALQMEAGLRVERQEINLKSIFIGGGTPTCLSGGLLGRLFTFIGERFNPVSDLEWTIEANPGTLSNDKLELIKQSGINRISLGVQTFERDLLKLLGRIHSSDEVEKSFALAREAGFYNINLDLMYGLPGQTMTQWEKTLQKAISLNPEHLSLYQLKIEKNTPMGYQLSTGNIKEFDDGWAEEMYRLANDYLNTAGFQHYEISNYAKPGYQCLHNKAYWLTKPYLGLGVGAHSFIPPARLANLESLENYIVTLEKGEIPPFQEEILPLNIQMSEFMFMGLRLIEGVNLEEFKLRFAKDARIVFQEAIEKCLNLGLTELTNTNIRLTEKGIVLGNYVFEQFLL